MRLPLRLTSPWNHAHTGAGQPVVYIATGSIVEPTKQQVAAIAGAIRSAAAAGVRFIWALPKVVAALLPEGTQEAVGGEQLLIMDWAPQQVRTPWLARCCCCRL